MKDQSYSCRTYHSANARGIPQFSEPAGAGCVGCLVGCGIHSVLLYINCHLGNKCSKSNKGFDLFITVYDRPFYKLFYKLSFISSTGICQGHGHFNMVRHRKIFQETTQAFLTHDISIRNKQARKYIYIVHCLLPGTFDWFTNY